MTDNKTKSVGWSDQLDELALELSNITEILGDLAYELEEKKPPYSSITTILFSCCNHVSRIAEDIRRVDLVLDDEKHRRVSEAVRTIEELTPYRVSLKLPQAR